MNLPLTRRSHFWTEVGATGSSLSLVALSIDRNLAVAIFRYVSHLPIATERITLFLKPKARGNRRLLWIAVGERLSLFINRLNESVNSPHLDNIDCIRAPKFDHNRYIHFSWTGGEPHILPPRAARVRYVLHTGEVDRRFFHTAANHFLCIRRYAPMHFAFQELVSLDLLVRVKRQQKVIQTRRKRSRKEADKRTRKVSIAHATLLTLYNYQT